MFFGLLAKKTPYKPQWHSFERMVNGTVFAMNVDTGHTSLLDQKDYRNILVVSLKSAQPDARGIPSEEEQKIAAAASQKIYKALEAVTQAFFIGTVCGEGNILLYYALVQPVEENTVLEGLSGTSMAHAINWAEDARWQFIKTALYPTDKELQHIVNATMLEVIKVEQGKGNEAAVPQGAAHTVFFKDLQDGRLLAEELKPGGYYQIGQMQSVKNRGETALPFYMELGKDGTLDIGSINAQTDMLIDAVAKYKARYDGWQAMQGAPVQAAA